MFCRKASTGKKKLVVSSLLVTRHFFNFNSEAQNTDANARKKSISFTDGKTPRCALSKALKKKWSASFPQTEKRKVTSPHTPRRDKHTSDSGKRSSLDEKLFV